MPKTACALATLLLLASAARAAAHDLEITLVHNDQSEVQTKTQLERLLSTYDATPYIFTRKIAIESGLRVIPHSDPVLTLSTKRLKDDELLLSTFVHEQMHWYLKENLDAKDAAIKELRTIFPSIPVGYPQGSMTEDGNYEHLLVCELEYHIDQELFGRLRARQVIEFWATDHYTFIYKAVLERGEQIDAILRKYKLEPVQHAPANGDPQA